MILKFTIKQTILYIVWMIVILLSLFLLINTNYIMPSFLLFLINLFICIFGFILTYKKKRIYLFEPVLYVLFGMLFYFGIIGMYYFSKFNTIPFFCVPTHNEILLAKIILLYMLFVIFTLVPNYIFILNNKYKINFNITFFKRNLDNKKINRYLYISQIILILLIICLFIVTNNSPISALNNVNSFRYEYTHGFGYGFFILFNTFLSLHLLIALYIFIFKINFNKSLFFFFIAFYLFWIIISGSRTWLVLPFMYFLYLYFLKNKLNLNVKKIFTLLVSGIIVLTFSAIYRVYRDLNSAVGKQALYQMQNINVVNETLSRCDCFSNSIKYFVKIDNKYGDLFAYNDFQYLSQIFATFTNYIPREYLPQKKYLTNGELTIFTYGKHVLDNGIIFHFGGISNFFYTGGLIGVILFAFLFGIFIYLINFLYITCHNYSFFRLFYIYAIFPIIINIFTSGILNIQILMLILYSSLLCFLQKFITEKKCIKF